MMSTYHTLDSSQMWYHETQVSEEGEARLIKYKDECNKNPGHKLFKPVETFSIKDLPKSHRNEDVYTFVKAVADLTVRVDVKLTSPNRPCYWPNSQCPYPFHQSKGSFTMRTGSGQIGVFMMIDGDGFDAMGMRFNALGNKFQRAYKTCPCAKCQTSDQPNHIWWEIIILTAAHVVFDDKEARNTTCRLFYDRDDSPVQKLSDLSIDYVNFEKDFCGLKFVTCDTDLGNELFSKMEYRFEMGKKVWEKYKRKSEEKFMFIVSHPHGCTKQVSFGHWKHKEKFNEFNHDFDFTKLTYTTSTCPGSSGAAVFCLGLFGANHVHSGMIY